MKKIIALMCVASAVALLASCGGEKTSATVQTTAQTTVQTTLGTTAATTREPYDEVTKDENGNVTEKTHYDENGKKVKYETFNKNGMPEKIYEYNKRGMATSYTLYTYNEHGALAAEYCEKGQYNSTGLVLIYKEIYTCDGNGKLLNRGFSHYNEKTGFLKNANTFYYDENEAVDYEDVTSVSEYDSYYVVKTERTSSEGVLLSREEQQINKALEVISSFKEVMAYQNGVLVSITKSEPIDTYTQVTVTYYGEDGKMLYSEGGRYGNSDLSVQMYFKITYHDNGRKHESFTYDPDMKLVSYYKDDTLGKRIGILTRRMEGEIYIYSGVSDDGLTEYNNLFLDKDFKITSGEIRELYSKGGNTKKSTWYESSGTATTYIFNTQEMLTGEEKYIDGVLQYVKKYEYETEETGTITIYDADGNVISTERFEDIYW
jgi:hypothetical protein